MTAPPTVILMTKRPDAGMVKTRLIGDTISANQAADIARAMLECICERLNHTFGGRVILGVTPDDAGDLSLPVSQVVPQGAGGLGDRLERIWRTAVGPDDPVAFFGIDSPDVPENVLYDLIQFLENPGDGANIAAGPTHDGGYWTLAAHRLAPEVLQRIDWGTSHVYDQTISRVGDAGIGFHALPTWYDVDEPEDVFALIERTGESNDPAITRLHERLTEILRPNP